MSVSVMGRSRNTFLSIIFVAIVLARNAVTNATSSSAESSSSMIESSSPMSESSDSLLATTSTQATSSLPAVSSTSPSTLMSSSSMTSGIAGGSSSTSVTMSGSSMPESSSAVAGSASSTDVISSSMPESSSTVAGSASSTDVISSSMPESSSTVAGSASSTDVISTSMPESSSAVAGSASSTDVISSSMPESSSTVAGSASSTPMISSSTPVSMSSTPVSISSTPVSSSSQSDVTSASVTVTPPTTIITTLASTETVTQFPTQPPNLGEAFFVLKLKIQVLNRTEFISNWTSEKNDFEAPFNGIPSFVEIVLAGNAESQRNGKTKREAGSGSSESTEVELEVRFTAHILVNADQGEFSTNLTQALDDFNTTLTGKNYSLSPVDVGAFVDSTRDACQAQSKSPLCTVLHRCVNGSCFHKCEFHQCSSHGQCYVQVDSPYSPQCRCVSDGVYDYSGPLCDDQALQARWVGAIVGGLSAVVLLVFVVAIVVYCCCRRQMKYKDDSSLESSSDDGYFRHSVAPRYETGYDNTSFQREGTADRYYPTRGAARYHSNPESLRADRPWFRRLPETFVIERPQVFLYRQPHPGWSS